jgi:plasmid stabilization system protein ParE
VAYKVLFTEDALVDLEAVLDYIISDNPSPAERFGISLLNHVELLQSLPRIGVPVPGRPGVRKILHSPVRVYYRLHDDRRLIEVLHFWHASRRDPIL